MSDFDRYTRVNKFEKRRKNTKLISLLIVAASFLVIILIGFWIFGPDDKPNNEMADSDQTGSQEETTTDEADGSVDGNTEQDSTDSNDESSQASEDETSQDDQSSTSDANGEEDIDSASIDTQPATPAATDDDNVVEAYTGDWPPVGTEQEGPHTTKFEVDSQEWLEMEKAIRLATGLSEEDMITWWLGNGGEQKAVGTVTNKTETEIYRVYISWVDNQGWQPTLVEVLKENDHKE